MSSSPCILIVDDDERNRSLLRAYLQGSSRLIEAENGADALAAVRSGGVDLVLLDVMMPGMDGFEACRAIKAAATDRFLPVLLLTALTEQQDRNQGLEAGADDFLMKPVDRRELMLRVRAFLRLREQEQLIHRQVSELRELDALKDDLVSLMVHDLRNPLGGLLGILHVVRDEVDALLREDIDAALGAADRMRETLDDMLQVRLLENKNFTLARVPGNVRELVLEAVTSIAGTAREKGIPVLDTGDGDVIATIDRKLVRRAVENLVVNAVNHSSRGSAVEVHVERRLGQVAIEVRDRGSGIPDTAKTKLFDKFASHGNAGRRGFGLGLYMVRLVVHAHQGEVVATDRDGGGTVLRLTLPIADGS